MGEEERKAAYTELRRNAIQKTHKTIIINGTKKATKHSAEEISDGTLEEGHISIDQGNVVIPLSVTGGAAKQIWQEINATKSEYSQSESFQNLSTGTTFEAVLEAVKKIIKSN